MKELFENLGIDGKLLFAQAINFLLLFFILHKVVFKRLFVMLEARKARIEKGLELTTKAEQEMQRINEARAAKLHKAQQESELLLVEARAAAQKQARDMQALAKKDAERISLRAKEDAEIAKKDALKQARQEMKEAALMVAQRVLERNMTKQDQDRLAQEVLGELESMHEK